MGVRYRLGAWKKWWRVRIIIRKMRRVRTKTNKGPEISRIPLKLEMIYLYWYQPLLLNELPPCSVSCLDYVLGWIHNNHSFFFKIHSLIQNYWLSMHCVYRHFGCCCQQNTASPSWSLHDNNILVPHFEGVHGRGGPEETSRGKCLVFWVKPCQQLWSSVS